MTLPLSRNTTYAAGTPIKSVDLNDIQDQIIGGKHGTVATVQAPWDGILPDTGGAGGGITVVPSGIYYGPAAGTEYQALRVPEGSRLISVEARLQNAAGGTTLKLWRQDMAVDAPRVQVGATQTAAVAAGRQTLTVAVPETCPADAFYFLEWSFASTNLCWGVVVTTQRP